MTVPSDPASLDFRRRRMLIIIFFFLSHNERFYPSECGDQCKAKRRAEQKSYPRRN
jgi:hypothetical protein